MSAKAEYPPFRVWMETVSDNAGEPNTYISDRPFRGADCEGIVLPVDPAQIDDWAVEEMVEVMAKALCDKAHDENPEANTQWNLLPDDGKAMWKAEARAALAALLAHLAEVSDG